MRNRIQGSGFRVQGSVKQHVSNVPGLSQKLIRSAGHPQRLPSWLPAGRSVVLACARHGLYHGWRMLKLPAGSAVLVPAFVCDTVTQPLRLAGAQVVFYRVREDLSPDLDDAAEMLARNPGVQALLWYHYLGFSNGMADAQRFCRERGLFFIEDGAHALPGSGAGTWGDLAVFSIRKTLPVTNAGVLVINRRSLLPLPDLSLRSADGGYAQILHAKEQTLRQRGNGCGRAATLRHVEYVSRLNSPRRVVRENARAHLHDDDRPLRRMARPFGPDELSLCVMQNADLPAIAAARRRNYGVYLRELGEWALFPNLPGNAVPLGFSIRVPDRDAFRLRLTRLGVESMTHWPDWLLPSPARPAFAVARHLADTLLTLPCHQDLDGEEIEYVCRAAKEAAGGKGKAGSGRNRGFRR